MLPFYLLKVHIIDRSRFVAPREPLTRYSICMSYLLLQPLPVFFLRFAVAEFCGLVRCCPAMCAVAGLS